MKVTIGGTQKTITAPLFDSAPAGHRADTKKESIADAVAAVSPAVSQPAGAAPTNGTPTSSAAADQIQPRANTLRLLVLGFLEHHGPSTDEAIQQGLKMNPSTQRPRRIELVKLGYVRDSGRRGKTRSGRAATLWEVRR